MTAKEFYKLCAGHDWTYEFSDDHRSWLRGREQHGVLMEALANNPELKKIYSDWVVYINSPQGLPKPSMPVDF